ncbi:MAG: sugar transferase, partial [Candidatus Pacebacteria bacterium]|nr:sugar transferase [Candidatus Paceibacterota bacterium]
HIRLYRLAKRVIDIVVVLLLVPVCIIICPLVIAALKIQYLLGAGASKALIKQERIGLNRRIFTLYKFRSMICDDTGVWHNDISKVVTPLGKFLRKSRIDELPQLFNILRGDMSLVGPRPDMVNLGKVLSTEIDYYDTRYIVQPGLTGWAQVSQRIIPQSINENKSRLEYDLYYIKNQSLFLELDIILKTMRRLLIDVFTK